MKITVRYEESCFIQSGSLSSPVRGGQVSLADHLTRRSASAVSIKSQVNCAYLLLLKGLLIRETYPLQNLVVTECSVPSAGGKPHGGHAVVSPLSSMHCVFEGNGYGLW